jgi:Concanavalin A-like lectin/glucanases superfamily
MKSVLAIALAPLLLVALVSSCATASVGDGDDGGSAQKGTSTQNASDASSTDYGQTADAQAADDAHAASDAAIAIEAGIPISRDQLVGEWLFTDNLNDTSGNAYDGVATGATFGIDRFGHANSAAVFNGINQYISVPSESDFSLNGDLTISAWINPAAITQLAGIASKCQSSSCAAFTFRLGFSGDIDLDSNTASTAVPSQVTTGTWQHVAGVMSGSTATIYVNGVSMFTHVQGFTPQVRNNTLRFGVDYQASFFDGSIDDIRVYTRALSAAEISALAAEK